MTTPISTLTAGGSGLVGIYNDLGSGTLFGSLLFSEADNGSLLSINLNASALAAISAAISGDGNFAIGGSTAEAGSVPSPLRCCS